MITTNQVNKFRQITNVGIIDCKNALVEANGDFNIAIEILRLQGKKVTINQYVEKEKGFVKSIVNEENTKGVIEKFTENDTCEVETLEGNYISAYTHTGNKIAIIVAFSEKTNPEMAKNIAMQIAAMNPIAIEEIPEIIIKKEIAIIKKQLIDEGKQERIIDIIAKGKLQKFCNDNTLLNQSYIKDLNITVKQYIKSFDKNLKITDFKRVDVI